MQKVYIAGPLFSVAERDFNLRVAALVEASGMPYFLPQRDSDPEGRLDPDSIFAANLRGLEGADLVVCNLEGIDVDSGTAWEIGYAAARGKSIIGIRTDFRKGELGLRCNLMVDKSVHIATTLGDLGKALKALQGGEL
jgi:nucleoside 2-deoxyribosyltransferase